MSKKRFEDGYGDGFGRNFHGDGEVAAMAILLQTVAEQDRKVRG